MKNKTAGRLLSCALALAMLFTLLPGVAQTARAADNTATYRVEYYLEGPSGYELQTGDTLSDQIGTVGDTVTAPSKTYPGYTKIPTQDSLESSVVAADGSMVLKVYYRRNTDTPYKVEYYLENASGSYDFEESEDKTGTTGAAVTADTKTFTGYTETTTPDTLKSSTIAGNGSTVLKVYYKRVIPVVASVTPSGTGTARSGNIVITFNSVMGTAIAGTVSLNGTELTGTGAWSTTNVANDTYTIPYPNLAYSTNYTIKIEGFVGTAGSVMVTDESHSFTTAASSGGGTPTPTNPPAKDESVKIGDVEIPYTKDESGTVSAAPTEQQAQKIIEAAQGGPVVFDFSGIEGLSALTLSVDPKWFDGAGDVIVLLADDVSLTIQDGMMGELVNRYGGLVEFRLIFGSVTVDIRQDGKTIDWYSYEYPMTVSLTDESGDAVRSVMRDADGAVIARSWYADGNVYAKVYQSGTYDKYLSETTVFTDMNGHWAGEAVEYMSSRDVIDGVGNNLFAPERSVTRAEFLTMLMRTLNPEPQGAWMVQQFDDVPEGAYYYDAALKAKALGIVNGTGDNKFNPNATITRQDMFTMLYRAMELMNMTPEIYIDQWIEYSDWDGVSAYASSPIQNLAKLGLVSGKGGGVLDPIGTASRAEAAQLIYNLLKYDAE